MHSSEKSIPLLTSISFSFKLITKFASRLDPISLLALFASMLILQISLIFFNSNHFLFNFSLEKFFGISIKFSK